MEIYINNHLFEVQVERKRIKNLYLRFISSSKIKINCNYNFDDNYIKKFIESKASWIIKTSNMLKVKENDGYQVISDKVYFLGYKNDIKIYIADKNNLIYKNNTFNFYLKKNDHKIIEKLFIKFFEDYFIEYINKNRIKYDFILKNYGINNYPNIKIKKLRGRWGYCIPSKNEITLNYRLAHYPIECFDYVLLHEYIHLIEPNHSNIFYDIVRKYMPDYKKYVEILKY